MWNSSFSCRELAGKNASNGRWNCSKRLGLPRKSTTGPATYRVATTDYLQRGSAYPALGACRLVAYRPEIMREVLESYLSRRDMVDAAFSSRWVQEAEEP